jgi:hypothetical protein
MPTLRSSQVDDGNAAAGGINPWLGRIRFDEQPAADSTDEATIQTVRRMCEYIRSSAQDTGVQAAAEYAARHFAIDGGSQVSLAWAVFWYVKHCVKFRQDEATMFRIGRANEYDLLIAPDVLVRMKDPSEDCDGFTMLTAALLRILGVPVYIATVAANGSEPWRWSHVFAVALVDGRVFPLDTSHGPGPGWMVPRDRIYRWQAWDLDAKPVDITPAAFQGLHGYVRSGFGGFGQICEDGTDDCLTDYTPSPVSSPVGNPVPVVGGVPTLTPSGNLCPAGTVAIGSNCFDPTNPNNTVVGTPASTSVPAGSSDLTTLLASLFGNAAKVATVAETPTTTITLPNGTVVSGVTSTSAASLLGGANLTAMLPILGIGLAAFLLISMMGSKR